MYKSAFTDQWEDCPLDPKQDCDRSSCKGCVSNAPEPECVKMPDCRGCKHWDVGVFSGPMELCYPPECKHDNGMCLEMAQYLYDHEPIDETPIDTTRYSSGIPF